MPHRPLLLVIVSTLCFAALCSVVILHPFTPAFPEAGLDPSWSVVLGEQAASHARWGVDLDFTYGPASPLVTGYYNTQYLTLTLPLVLFFCLVHGGCAALLLIPRRQDGASTVGSTFIAPLCYALALLFTPLNVDAFYFSTMMLVFLLDIERDANDRFARSIVLLGLIASGIFAMSKLSYGIAAVPLYFLADCRALYARRWPWRLALTALSFVVADLAYGQHLSDLPNFLLTQKDIIGGYTEAMSAPGSRNELTVFLAAAAFLGMVTLIVEVTRPRPWSERLLLPIGLLSTLFVVFKAGFVRQDLHTLISWTSAALIGLMIALNRMVPHNRVLATILGLGSLGVLIVVNPYIILLGNDEEPNVTAILKIHRGWFLDGPPREINAMLTALASPTRFVTMLDEAKSQAWAGIHDKSTLPKLNGSIDIIQSDQSTLIAQGLDYHPRPSFQEYFTYTPALIAANRTFFESDAAPEWLLFAPGSIDERSPTSAEGALWPLFLRRYEPVQLVDQQVALHRRPQADDEILGPSTTRTARFDEAVDIRGAGAVFAKITVHPTWLGRLATLLYRSPLLTLIVRYADGQEASYRFIPNLGASGFLLSPLVTSANDYVDLSFGDLQSLAGKRILDVRIVGNRAVHLAYAAQINYDFAPLDVEKLSRGSESDALFNDIASRRQWRDLVIRLGRQSDLDGSRLSLQPPKSITVPVNGIHRMKIRFGIETEAWTKGKPKGVCFSLRSDLRPDALWMRCLDPLMVEADRGDQLAEIDLPPATDKVQLNTECRIDCDWAWSYISNVEFMP